VKKNQLRSGWLQTFLWLKFGWLQTISTKLLNLNWNDCQHEWCTCCCCLFLYCYKTCNHKKFRNNENDSLQITCWSLTGVSISLYYSNIHIIWQIFGRQNLVANSASRIFRCTKIWRKIWLSVAAWGSTVNKAVPTLWLEWHYHKSILDGNLKVKLREYTMLFCNSQTEPCISKHSPSNNITITLHLLTIMAIKTRPVGEPSSSENSCTDV